MWLALFVVRLLVLFTDRVTVCASPYGLYLILEVLLLVSLGAYGIDLSQTAVVKLKLDW